jgi:hypothetical protein
VRITIEMAGGKLISARLPYLAHQLSVQKVVPTLTSNITEIYVSMAGAKQHNDMGLSWFRSWAVRPAGVRSGRYIVLHLGACRGELQVK